MDIFRTIEKCLGVKNTYISVPFCIAYSMAWILYLITFTKFDFREKVQRLVKPRVFDYIAAEKDFGYAPVDFPQGVKEEVQMYIAQKTEKIVTYKTGDRCYPFGICEYYIGAYYGWNCTGNQIEFTRSGIV